MRDINKRETNKKE